MAIKTPTITDLDSTQRDVVMYQPYDAPMFVNGPPGSGKTHVAILRLQVLLNNGFSNVLFLLYNHSMYGFLRTVFDKMGIRTNIDINTKDIFLLHLAWGSGYFDRSSIYETMYGGALDFLLNNQPNLMYDVIVIDECQDFNDKELTIFSKMSSKIIAVGDTDQTVYMTSTSPFFKTLPSRKLKTIYRFGRKIAQLAQGFSKSSESLVEKVSVNTNTDAYRVTAENDFDAFEKIARIIKAKRHTNQTIAVLTLTGKLINSLHSGLQHQGINTFKAINNNSFRNYNFDSNTPLLITPFSAKGMEFDVVILYGYSSELLNWREFAPKRDSIIYVSLTRTSDELYLISQNDTHSSLRNLSGWVDMDTARSDRDSRFMDGF